MTPSQPNDRSNLPQSGGQPDCARRQFLKQSSVASAAVTLGLATESIAESSSPNESLNVGIVGTGGRGGGAARDTLAINPNVRLVAMADLYPEKCHSMRKSLARRYDKRVAVDDKNIFAPNDNF